MYFGVGIPNYTEIMELLKNGLTLEAKEKIMELREAVMELQEENLWLKQKLREFEFESDLTRNMYFDRGIYWLRKVTEDGTNREGPFCQVCFDRDRKPVRLQRAHTPQGGWFCAACRNHF
ncbi:conserved hypothetical protein [Verrucomicrobia bacterium]|nr:conserved hypothetical protein [Verrucomicrobiota bacterium]